MTSTSEALGQHISSLIILEWYEYILMTSRSQEIELNRYHRKFWSRWVSLLFSFIFVFSNTKYNFTTNKCEKFPSSIRCRDSNSRPLEHESPPITTRPGLKPNNNSIVKKQVLPMIKVKHKCHWTMIKKWKLKTNKRGTNLSKQQRIETNGQWLWHSWQSGRFR